MSKNLMVEDTKPKNIQVFDAKPSNSLVEDTKPKNVGAATFETEQLYTQVLGAGMYMGIPPHTYPEAGTVISSFSP